MYEQTDRFKIIADILDQDESNNRLIKVWKILKDENWDINTKLTTEKNGQLQLN